MRSDSPDTLVWLPVSNAAGETIPAFAAMRVTGVDSDGIFTVAKPNADSAVTNIMFNGPVEIESGLYGHGTFGIPCSARYDTADGTPANGDEWGVESSGWKLRNAKLGFKIQGSTDSSNGVATVVRNLDAAAAGGGLDLSGRTGSITDVTALQILRGVVSGTAGAAVFTPDLASSTLPGIISSGGGIQTIDMSLGIKTQGGICFDPLAASGHGAGDGHVIGVSDDFPDWICVWRDLGLPSSDAPDGYFRAYQLRADGQFNINGTNGASGTDVIGNVFSGGVATTVGGSNLSVPGSVAFTGDISPAQLTANTNDWNPTGW